MTSQNRPLVVLARLATPPIVFGIAIWLVVRRGSVIGAVIVAVCALPALALFGLGVYQLWRSVDRLKS